MSEVESIALVIHSLNRRASAVVHSIIKLDDFRYTLGAGRVLDIQEKAEIVNILSDRDSCEMDLIPSNVVAFRPNALVWWRPASNTQVCVDNAFYKVETPPLLFAFAEGSLFVFALKENSRPKHQTKLYHCGFPNIDINGLWCAGGNHLPTSHSFKKIEQIEDMFFESPFTNHGASPLKKCNDNSQFWKNKSRVKQFPLSKLVANNKTLGDFISEIKNIF